MKSQGRWKRNRRAVWLSAARALVLSGLCAGALVAALTVGQASATGTVSRSTGVRGTIPPVAPVLLNGEMECADGYAEGVNGAGTTIRWPTGWTYAALAGTAKVNSARIQYTKACDGQGHVERIGGEDSFVIRAHDIETPPEPGKPFDSVIYQQVAVEPGGDYSLSGWTLSLCGGSAVPNDCPDGYYMAKMLGLDPTGGTDANASSVRWVENRANFITPDGERVGWSNLSISAPAEAVTMTVFARLNSPFRWHGNHGFIDSLSLIRAPVVTLDELPATVAGDTVALSWTGEQSPDVDVPGGTFQLLIDIQVQPEDGAWRDVLVAGAGTGTQTFQAPCRDMTYAFRIRARAEQVEGAGVWPNQRYPGTWSAPQTVEFQAASGSTVPVSVDDELPHKQFMPVVRQAGQC
ncbi:MAG: hypothetical protein H6644_20060 [Caldilineaceae bacterium]|nr:hypothetical protein [Caldilineaceae bacterium]